MVPWAFGWRMSILLRPGGQSWSGAGVATGLVPEEEATRTSVRAVAECFQRCRMPDVVGQLERASGDEIPTTPGSVMEGAMLLRRIELVHEDLVASHPEMDMGWLPRVGTWAEGAQRLARLISAFFTSYRHNKRVAGGIRSGGGEGKTAFVGWGGAGRRDCG
ncbi:MAG: hypothetical protein SGPRY_008488 [Prymnesium sp.]